VLTIDHLPDFLSDTLACYWERFSEQLSPDTQALMQRIETQPELSRQIARVWACSDYAANLCIENPEILAQLIDSDDLHQPSVSGLRESLQSALNELTAMPAETTDDAWQSLLKQVLRQFQKAQMLRLIWRDVTQQSSVRETAADVSLLAEVCLDVTLELLYQRLSDKLGVPVGEYSGDAQQLVVLGMGKLGAGELNLSSDIDLIFAYPEPGETESGTSCQQFFLKLGQQLIDALDAVTADGFVFRVDMRLRPYGSEGVLVCSFDAMENYYQLQGRDWERYAMIKARAVAGDLEAGQELLDRLRPFSYRRYLDFSAIESLRSMKLQINKQVRRKGMHEDIKLGAGGIREVEFIVQALQMVHGGRDKQLQQVSLYKAMDMIVEGEYLPEDTIQQLRNAYNFLRDLEHKLQAFANKQTQSLPDNAEEQKRVAVAMAFPNIKGASWDMLMDVLEQHREIVRGHFKEVIHLEDEDDDAARHDVDVTALASLWQGEKEAEAAQEQLAQLGFENPVGSVEVLLEFKSSRLYKTLPNESRQRFARFMPLMLATLAQEKTPSLGLSRVMILVNAVARRTAYLVLLSENPNAMKQFVQLCTASPFVAEFLSQHPVLLDELLTSVQQPPGKQALEEELAQGILRIPEDSVEEQMEFLRYFKQCHTLQVAAAQITGSMTVMKVSDYLTFTAEAILEQVLALCWQELTRKHGFPVNGDGQHGAMDFVVIAYGKLGGIELSYLSDLDVVFIHDGALDEETVVAQGQRAINSREFYTRLAQRIMSMLGTQTVSGKLYEIDMRLRPSGESGLLVTTLPAFEKYQRNEAWTWEHQALVRSRAVAGSTNMGRAFELLRAKILQETRDKDSLTKDVVKMRQRMRDELTRKAGNKAKNPAFVLKQAKGGIVDIEFMVQYIVLSGARDCPDLTEFSDNMRILEAAERCDVLSGGDIQVLMEAYLALRSTLHEFALQQIDSNTLSDDDAAAVLDPLSDTRDKVVMVWNKLFPDNTKESRAAL
tara:strand:- start:917 stop:3919 length:3003 start_codon:yes stop_codon:yes gene_type:complete